MSSPSSAAQAPCQHLLQQQLMVHSTQARRTYLVQLERLELDARVLEQALHLQGGWLSARISRACSLTHLQLADLAREGAVGL